MVDDAVTPGVGLCVVAVEDPQARDLQDRHIAEMAHRYGGAGPAPLRGDEFEPPAGCFVMAMLDGVGVACGGFRRLSPSVAEIKRMFVDPAVRRRGFGALVLAFLEERAKVAGYTETWLETGVEQPDAISLYVAAGYRPRPGYGEFKDDPRSRSFFQSLVA